MNRRVECFFMAVGLALTVATAGASQESNPAPPAPDAANQAPDVSGHASSDPAAEALPPEMPPEDPGATPVAPVAPGEAAESLTGTAPGQPPGAARPIAGPSPVVPAITGTASRPVQIGPPAQQALAESHAWAENPDAMPTRDNGGRVIFAFSESVPTIVCAVWRVCDLELQSGETVQGAPHIGDAVRWKIAPAFSGTEERKTTHLVIKPTEVGLDTNLVVPTDRRTYHLRLVSSLDRYVSSVGFSYPEDDLQSWKELNKTLASAAGVAGGGGDTHPVAVSRLNFDYQIKVVKGKPRFKPLHAMDDGYHTYIAMSEVLPEGEAPALLGIARNGEEQMVNYRLQGNIYVIDGTVDKLALVSGVGGGQQRVELERHLCQVRGGLGVCGDPQDQQTP